MFLYSLADYQGEVQFVPIGGHADVVYNDQVSSVRVPKGIEATLYEAAQLQGRSLRVTRDVADLRHLGFDDITSSLHVSLVCAHGCGNGVCVSHTPEKCHCHVSPIHSSVVDNHRHIVDALLFAGVGVE